MFMNRGILTITPLSHEYYIYTHYIFIFILYLLLLLPSFFSISFPYILFPARSQLMSNY